VLKLRQTWSQKVIQVDLMAFAFGKKSPAIGMLYFGDYVFLLAT
jgi:hypothetical protein